MALSPTSSHGIRSGDGSPSGVITDANSGDLYRDTTNGALYICDPYGNWTVCGGTTDAGDYEVGVAHGTNDDSRFLAKTGYRAVVSDLVTQNDSGNGLYWNVNRGADGAQILEIVTGATGNFSTRVDAKGHMRPSTLVLTNHAAPADADLAAGDCALWFDQTNGAAKLMIKGKSANGTVVTGTVALA